MKFLHFICIFISLHVLQTLYEAVELIVVTATGVSSLVVVDLVVISVLIVVFNISAAS